MAVTLAAPREFSAAVGESPREPPSRGNPEVKPPDTSFQIEVRGRSMHPVIRHGDVLVTDRSREARDGEIVAASVNGRLLVRRLFQRGGVTALLPENPDYSPLDVTSGFDFRLLGVVTRIIRSRAPET